MIDEVFAEIVGYIVGLWGNPAGKALSAIASYLVLVGSAKGKSGEQKADSKNTAKKNHSKRIRRFSERKIKMLKDRFWHMVKLFDKAVPTDNITVHLGHGKTDYPRKETYRRDYFDACKYILLDVKVEEVIYDMDVEANTFKTVEERDFFINEYASDFRSLLLGDIHKRVGHNERIDSMEDAYVPFEYIREMIARILTEVEKSNNILINEVEEIDKVNRVSFFNPMKVLRVLKGKEE